MAKPVIPLNEEKCKSLRFSEKGSNRLFDGEGLYLEVLPTGGKRWRLRYLKADGKESLLTLGNYPEVQLKLARQLRAQVKEAIPRGEDVQTLLESAKGTKKAQAAPVPKKKVSPVVLPVPRVVAVPQTLNTPAKESVPKPLNIPLSLEDSSAPTWLDPQIHVSLSASFEELSAYETSQDGVDAPVFLGFGRVENSIQVPEQVAPESTIDFTEMESFELKDQLTIIEPHLSDEALLALESEIKTRLLTEQPTILHPSRSGLWKMLRSTPVLSAAAGLVLVVAMTWYFAKTTVTAQVEQKISQLELIEKNKQLVIEQLKQSNQQSVQENNQLRERLDQIQDGLAQKEKLEQEQRSRQ